MGLPDLDPKAMTVDERLTLIGILWDSLEEDDVPLTPAQQEELERRVAEMEANPHDQVSWEEVKARLEAQARKPGPHP